MTKKDYIILAENIKQSHISLKYASVNIGETNRCIEHIVVSLCAVLQRDNSRFSQERFLTACGFGELYQHAMRESASGRFDWARLQGNKIADNNAVTEM